MSSTIANPKPNQMMTCPYNKAHQVQHYRMHIHLQKCRKQYPKSAKTTCPFNATHVIHDAKLDFHVSKCPDRFIFDTQKYDLGDEVPQLVLPPIPVIECEETWEEGQQSTYVPDPTNKPHVIRKVKGATPSERHRARMEGIRSYRPLQN